MIAELVLRFLFCSLAGPGLLFPAIGIAQILTRRGHEVAFATGKGFGPLLDRLGLQRLPCSARDVDSFQVATWFLPPSIALQVKHVEHAFQGFPADVVVGQPLALGAMIAAERIARPLAVLGLASYLWPTGTELLERPPIEEHERRSLSRYNEMMSIYNGARRLFGLAECSECYRCSPLLGDLYLLQSVPALAGDPQGFPEAVRFVGSCLWEPEEVDPGLAAWLAADDGRPVVYAQCGRSFHRPSPWTAIAKALDHANVRIAASAGRMDGVAEAPPGWYVRDHVPQGQVLPRARAVITGGNSTAVLGALTQGLPLLILPGGGEQQEIAERCTAAGAALRLDGEPSPSAISEALHRLLNEPGFTLAAQGLAHTFAAYNGLHRASRLLEDLGGSRPAGC